MMQQRCLFVVHCGRNALAKQRYAEASLKATAAARDRDPHDAMPSARFRADGCTIHTKTAFRAGPPPAESALSWGHQDKNQGTWREVPLSTELAAGGCPPTDEITSWSSRPRDVASDKSYIENTLRTRSDSR